MNPFLSRRSLLKSTSVGFGYLAFAGLSSFAAAQEKEAKSPLSPKPPHFEAKAKRVIFLCMTGGPSHVDTFDYKPNLIRDSGKPSRFRGNLLRPVTDFSQRGDSGLWISDALPGIASHADDLCLIRSMHCDQPIHPRAVTQMHTGNAQFLRPSIGAWTLYGLGSENENLPGFISLGAKSSESQTYGSAFLPSIYGGTRVGQAAGRFGNQGFQSRFRGGGAQDAVPDIRNPSLSEREQRAQLDFIQSLNQRRKAESPLEPDVDGVIESYEMAFRMQDAMPDLMDVSKESQATQQMYGLDQQETAGFGRQCLLARRFVEAGVRFVQVTSGNWDHHQRLSEELPNKCRSIDTPIAGLLADLKQRDMLKDTLVIWSGEFGRTPYAQNGDGRDHNNKGYTSWMAGGGVKGGFSFGATDEYGYEAVTDKCHIHDWHATILHLLGFDHERLTYRYAGRDYRLTDVHGNVLKEIVA